MQSQVSDMEKQLLQVELKTTKDNLQRAKQRMKDLRGKLDTSENSRIEMKLELSRLERQIKRLNSNEAMKRHSLESATKDIELETLRRANGRLKRRVSQLEDMNTSWRWKSGTSFSFPRYSIPTSTSNTDYDSGCWSSVSPANSLESLDNRSDFDDSVSTISTSVFHPTTSEQLEQVKSELAETRQKEQAARQQLEKNEEESKKKIKSLTLDVQAADAEKQSILLKMEALERHSKNLQAKVSSYQLLESEDAKIKQKLDELLKTCEEMEDERCSLLDRTKELEERLAIAEEHKTTAECVSQAVQTETDSTPSSPDQQAQLKEMEKQMNRLKKENRRLRLKLKIKEEDEQAAREECALAKMRASLSNDYYTEVDRPIARSHSVHEKNAVCVLNVF
jgi:chromosome segregation ATPase